MTFVPLRVSFSKEGLRAHGRFRSKTISFSEIKLIEIGRVLSLADEVGVAITAGVKIFFTDADPWFRDAAKAMRFDELFGDDWYGRAERGEYLKHDGGVRTG